jgi:hypothetical protein
MDGEWMSRRASGSFAFHSPSTTKMWWLHCKCAENPVQKSAMPWGELKIARIRPD